MTSAPGNTVQSAAQAMRALQALASCGPAASLSILAAEAGMPPAKLHRYLQALIATGFASQQASGGRYALGPAAITLGLAAIARLDPADAAAGVLPDLRDATGHTCFFAVWGNQGPTVIRTLEPAGAVTIVTRAGSVLPAFTSATGLAFAAHLTPEALAALKAPPHAGVLAKQLAEIRHSGIATIHGTVLAGIDAAAAPIFGIKGIAGVITVLGPTGAIDLAAEGPTIAALRRAATACGRAIGGSPDPHGALHARKPAA